MFAGFTSDFSEASSSADEAADDTDEDVSLRLDGTDLDDNLIGSSGDDSIFANAGDDTVLGDEGDDFIKGGPGSDLMRGQDGDDLLKGGAEDDTLKGGDGDDTISGGAGDDFAKGGDGNDHLTSGYGQDTLQGGAGNDVLIGSSENDPDGIPDVLEGDSGSDQLWGVDGDLMSGGSGADMFFINVDIENAEPVVISDLQIFSGDGPIDQVNFVKSNGSLLTAEDLFGDHVTLAEDPDGDNTLVYVDGQLVVKILGHRSGDLASQSSWIGNFSQDEDDINARVPPGDLPDTVQMTVTDFATTGQSVSDSMMGGNVVYKFNTEDGQPLSSVTEAIAELDIANIRYPGGQAEPGLDEVEGVDWLNVVQMQPNELGEMDLRPEVQDLLDWARDPDGDGDPKDAVTVSLVIPTKHLSLAEYDAFAIEIEAFAKRIAEDYADVVTAFEIGNEYWSDIGEAEYAAKVNIAAVALAKGMQSAGASDADQASVIVQMGSPYHGSDYHHSVDPRGFTDRSADANQAIVDGLSEAAREIVDGVVEHYYFNEPSLAFTDHANESNYIAKDFEIWQQAFSKELDLHITEWNVKSSNVEQNGMRAASTILEQFENMIEMGVDSAQAWPVLHNTTNDLAGGKQDTPILGDEGRLLNTVRGATFDVMSDSLVGAELLETEFSNDDGSVEINTFRSHDTVVIYVSSRSLEMEVLELNLSGLVPEFDSAEAIQIGYDTTPESSDGMHFVPGEGFQAAEHVLIYGEKYYVNEHDVKATLTGFAVDDSSNVAFTLKPFEVVELTFHL